jgi:thiol-disulfide isomerase/thioredoxin
MKLEEKKLDRLLICSYIIIGLLVANTIVLFLSNVKITTDGEKSKTAETTDQTTDNSNSEYDVSMMNSVDLDGVLKLFKSEKTQVIYLGRSTCGYCVQFLPVLQQAQKEYGYTTNYLDITTVSDPSKLLEKDNDEKFLEENYGATPMVILVKDGKLKDTWVGYSEYDEFAQFLEKNGFKK